MHNRSSKSFSEDLEKMKSNSEDVTSITECEYKSDIGRISNQKARKILEALKTNSFVTGLDLYERCIGNVLTAKFVYVLNVNKSLKFLSLMSSDINLANMTKFAGALASNETLKTLWLDGSRIENGGVGKIADALKTNHSLKLLSLCSINISHEAQVSIAGALKENTVLRILHLGSTNMHSKSAKEIFKALTGNSTLTQLSLNENRIDGEAAEELYEFLVKNKSVQTLSLEANTQIGERMGDKLAEAMKINSTLIGLRISYTMGPYPANKVINAIMENDSSNILHLDYRHDAMSAALKRRQDIVGKLATYWRNYKDEEKKADIPLIVLKEFPKYYSAISSWFSLPKFGVIRKTFRDESKKLEREKEQWLVGVCHLGVAKDVSPLPGDIFWIIYEHLKPGGITYTKATSSSAIAI